MFLLLTSLHDCRRLLTGSKKRDHISPAISDLLRPHTSSKSLRSSDLALLATPRSRLKTKGDRAFTIAAPKLWNNLSVY
ncbi:hypothetical protein LDENG_00088620 [Lucifuga dentata]|nr:hypothetical protein LDENG_00088620 [Lucifuga dentata]